MPLARRAIDVDAELGKKFDDSHERPGRFKPRGTSFTLPWRRLRRRPRVLLFLVGAYLLYLFFKNMPTDLRPAVERYDPRFAKPRPIQSPVLEDTATPDDEDENGEYDGKLRFPNLARSMQHARFLTKGTNNSVLFAAGDLSSVSDLIPLACEMARYGANTVHFALMGRDEVSIQGIQRVNGISDRDCPMFWHDARLDRSSSSSEGRLIDGVFFAVGYMISFLEPKVIIAHDDGFEENHFQVGIMDGASGNRIPLVSLSTKALSVMWISRLDSSSLQAWNDVNVDMLVHAPPDSSGSVKRLLDSLHQADYLGLKPSLTIELPSQTDPHLLNYLQRMSSDESFPLFITLRRRVSHSLPPEQSAIRTVEAFYPKDPTGSHLLFLSPQAELSPSFYHYLKYTTLRYRHSINAVNQSSHLLGVSLELPARNPTDDTLFSMQYVSDVPFFKWQVPNSNAALYFGDKWAELHKFLANRLAVSGSQLVERNTFISKKYPSVMEDLLEIMRAKGYYVLYPSFPVTQGYSLATIHNDLYQLPEEFQAHNVLPNKKTNNYLEDIDNNPDVDLVVDLGSIERPLARHTTINPLLQRLPLQVPELDSLPLLSFQGDILSWEEFESNAKKFASEFSTVVGGCGDIPAKIGYEEPYSIDDIFCLGDDYM